MLIKTRVMCVLYQWIFEYNYKIQFFRDDHNYMLCTNAIICLFIDFESNKLCIGFYQIFVFASLYYHVLFRKKCFHKNLQHFMQIFQTQR